MAARLKELYQKEIRPKLVQRFGYKNLMQAPRLEKIVLNMGIGEALQNVKLLDSGVEELGLIVGQRPVVRRARRSIANFRLREGMAIGCKVTLRGDRMYNFFDMLVNVGLPRVRDFKGVSAKSFDGRGDYALGIREQIVFPQIDYNKIEKVMGLGIVIATTAKTDEEARELLRLLGMPFRS